MTNVGNDPEEKMEHRGKISGVTEGGMADFSFVNPASNKRESIRKTVLMVHNDG